MTQAVFQLGRRRALADGHARAGGIQQRHRFIRQLTRRNIAMRQFHRRADRFVEE